MQNATEQFFENDEDMGEAPPTHMEEDERDDDVYSAPVPQAAAPVAPSSSAAKPKPKKNTG